MKLKSLLKRWYIWVILILGVFTLLATMAVLTLLTQRVVEANNAATPALVLNTPIPRFGPTIRISPSRGGPNTPVTITGEGWRPGDTVTVYLEAPSGVELEPLAMAMVTVTDEGRFESIFTYPTDKVWLSQPGFLLQAYGTESQALAVFTVAPLDQTPSPPVIEATLVLTDVARVSVGALTLRAGPGIAYVVTTLLAEGTQLKVLGQNEAGDWLLVRQANGTEGWVFRLFVAYEGLAATVATPSPPAPPPIAITQWRAEYWANGALEGAPALVRNDSFVDFNWGEGSPNITVPMDNFSARWTRDIQFEEGTYRFHVVVDDGARLWVDDQLLIDEWREGSPRQATNVLALVEGVHSLRVDFYEQTGGARIRLWWEKIVSPSYLSWRGEYWSNPDLRGSPALVRDDATLDFNWGEQAAAAGLPADNFSTRWSRWADFQPGTYRFRTQADDGIRVYLDGQLVLDKWANMNIDDVQAVDFNLSGPHWLVIEYRELSGDAKVKFWWDRVRAQPFPTLTPTEIPTPIPSASPTATLIPTATPVARSTPVPTATLVPIPVETPTATLQPTETLTPTVQATETPSATATPTDVPTPTETATPSS